MASAISLKQSVTSTMEDVPSTDSSEPVSISESEPKAADVKQKLRSITVVDAEEKSSADADSSSMSLELPPERSSRSSTRRAPLGAGMVRVGSSGSIASSISADGKLPIDTQPTWHKSLYFGAKVLLYYYPTFETVANAMAANSRGRIVLKKIKWGEFKDGFPDLYLSDASDIRWAHVAFLADLSSANWLFSQFAVMCSLPRHLAKSFKVLVPYFATGTMERVTEYGRIATARTLARLLSSIPQCAGGVPQICVCDIHALANQFFFSDSVLIRLETCVPLLLARIRKKHSEERVVICFPDDGAEKRFRYLFEEDFDLITCLKKRDGAMRKVVIKDGDSFVSGAHVLIVDDLVQSGGTLANCAKLLRKLGAAQVSCYVTHAVFPEKSWMRFAEGGENGDLFSIFYITDTIPNTAHLLRHKPPFKVLSVANCLKTVVLDDDSISTVEH